MQVRAILIMAPRSLSHYVDSGAEEEAWDALAASVQAYEEYTITTYSTAADIEYVLALATDVDLWVRRLHNDVETLRENYEGVDFNLIILDKE